MSSQPSPQQSGQQGQTPSTGQADPQQDIRQQLQRIEQQLQRLEQQFQQNQGRQQSQEPRNR